jgi:tRNA threonylcarbamoyladenosine biosynthesis protein TsaE
MQIKDIISNSEFDSVKFAEELVKFFKKGDIVALVGNLGSGKTFFVKKFCEALEINVASSPSFSIINEYQSLNGVMIYHFDFYRVKSVNELIDIGFYEYINNRSSISFIEWANLFPQILPKKKYEVRFEILNELSRKISLHKYD